MKMIGEEIHLETDEARSGATPHVMRYVLAISLALAVLAMSIIWISGAISLMPDRQSVTAEEHALGG